ncbi:MAG: adenylate/guanylate cyclase domain-containing protein [Rhizomicrobium sp.]
MPRKLTAIMSADVVGYSRMMEADEQGTLARLKANRVAIFDPQVAAFGGRIFKLMGDGALAEFASVVSAVQCALAIQSGTAQAEQQTPEAQRIRYRIGVNLGDVIVEGDDIYGDGVNIAARIQALAEPGGVAISSGTRDHLAGKVQADYKDMGEHSVKNIERPIHVFAVQAKPEAARATRVSICVLPFANMSDDQQQEYFSDGISEDIITDLSKVSALGIIARNTAFQYKGKSVDIPLIAKQLKVSHILEGSVRKAGNRLRITAQLIDGATGEHAWAERYDRNLDDIFALQDEISEAIVKALKLRLLPEEKKAIERRGTTNAEAYNLYLMARQNYVIGNEGYSNRAEAIVRLCKRATEIDPNYAQAWALMALGQMILYFTHGVRTDNGLAAAEHSLALDPDLPEAHAIKARILSDLGRTEEAFAEIAVALGLDPESYEVNKSAARLNFRQRAIEDAARYFEKATALMETDFNSPLMLMTCYRAIGNSADTLRVARIALSRAEKTLAQDQNNGAAVASGADALAALGERERAREWINRALLIDPDNMNMRYNFACTMVTQVKDFDMALEMLGPVFAKWNVGFIKHAKADPDLDTIRDDPRFKAMLAAAEARVAKEAENEASA